MIVDTSALVALIQNERPHAARVATGLAGTPRPAMCAPTATECLIVLTARHGPAARTVFDRLRAEINLEIAPFTEEHATVAHRAFVRYGKGRHPAALNFGDCMSYAAARVSQRPLLAVGSDFPHTDLTFDGVIGRWPDA